MTGFHFTESQWDDISAELERSTGRLKNDGDREILEVTCNSFVKLRPKLGKNQPSPKEGAAGMAQSCG